jgi:hypothetical protein
LDDGSPHAKIAKQLKASDERHGGCNYAERVGNE